MKENKLETHHECIADSSFDSSFNRMLSHFLLSTIEWTWFGELGSYSINQWDPSFPTKTNYINGFFSWLEMYLIFIIWDISLISRTNHFLCRDIKLIPWNPIQYHKFLCFQMEYYEINVDSIISFDCGLFSFG